MIEKAESFLLRVEARRAVFDEVVRALLPGYAAAEPDGTRDGELLLVESNFVEYASRNGHDIERAQLQDWLRRRHTQTPELVRRITVADLPDGPTPEVKRLIAGQTWWLNLPGLGFVFEPDPVQPSTARDDIDARVNDAGDRVRQTEDYSRGGSEPRAMVAAINANTAAQLAIVAQLGEIADLLRRAR